MDPDRTHWNLYGKKYDLSRFADYHPGGSEIIEYTRGLGDCTALFESYHAFSDISGILQSLAKYEIPGPAHDKDADNTLQTETDFTSYHELIERVKREFPDRKSLKATVSWYLWTFFSSAAYVYVLQCLFAANHIILKCVLAMACGTIDISILFNVLHDASHYGISTNPLVNNAISKLTNGWTLWNHYVWIFHHIYYHHSFTGGQKDPDHILYTEHPIFKRDDALRSEWAANIMYIVFPGQHIGQALWYQYCLIRKPTEIKGIKYELPDVSLHSTLMHICMAIKLAMFYKMGFILTATYIITENALYYINIIGDHDLCETRDNHYDGPDWARRQICNSGNFANDNWLWSIAFGGINYQIEHHLFPNMCNHHYPRVAPIVRQFCKEKGWPYVSQPTVMDAYRSFMKKPKMA